MQRRPQAFLSLAATTALLLAACTDDGDGQSGEFPRNETLYTTGAAWGPPSDWNPLIPGQVTGLNGLGYETLFLFDPNTVELTPWLAESGEWTGDLEYELRLRDGITWSDGQTLDADDVVYTVELGQIEAIPYSNVWNWLDTVEKVDDLTVRFTFSEARHQEWDNFLFWNQIVPEHVFSQHDEEALLTFANEDPVVSGPYSVHSHDQDRIVWEKRDGWWATDHLGLDVKPTYIVDIVNVSNEVTLNMLMQGQIDLSNNFLPGIQDLVDSDPQLTTYFAAPPYMLPANTAMLIPNTTREPMGDVEFRRAMANAIDGDQIVNGVYDGLVAQASPTGLLPAWERYYDQAVIDEHAFAFDTETARQILADAGYEDIDGDGFVETPDGDPISLRLNVPTGWTDWEEAARSIASDLRNAGIDVTEEFIDDGAVDDARTSGDFDLLINNWTGLTNSPWSHYNYLFRQPVQTEQHETNFSRWESEEGWALTQELASTASDDPRFAEILSELQRVSLEELPAIPIWYNGVWAQANNAVWTNWPSDQSETPDHYPSTWNEMWRMSSILMLTELEPAE